MSALSSLEHAVYYDQMDSYPPIPPPYALPNLVPISLPGDHGADITPAIDTNLEYPPIAYFIPLTPPHNQVNEPVNGLVNGPLLTEYPIPIISSGPDPTHYTR